jgi:hypothetical protein
LSIQVVQVLGTGAEYLDLRDEAQSVLTLRMNLRADTDAHSEGDPPARA